MLNGASSPSPQPGAENNSIGGAELTEIPWLRHRGGVESPVQNGLVVGSDLRTESTSVIDGPNGAGSIETVTVKVNGVSGHASHTEPSHGITQGELLRQEQEAGIVPVPSPTHAGRVTRSSAAATAAATRAVMGEDEEGVVVRGGDEPVHARGPDVIGMEDMGPQAPGSGLAGGLDLEGALGRRGEGESMASAVGRQEDGELNGEGEKHGEEQVVTANTDAGVDGGEGTDTVGDSKDADAVDGTTL